MSLFLRFIKFKKVQLIDFFLILILLFFPIGLIRPLLGYDSIIGHNLFKDEFLLIFSSLSVLLFIVLFLSGVLLFYKKNKNIKNIVYYRKSIQSTYAIKRINLIISFLVIYVMYRYILSQGNIIGYFNMIDSIRQTLSGQMLNFLLIYLNALIATYIILVEKRITLTITFAIIISIFSFVIFGFRGPVIGILVIVFLALQKAEIIKVKLNIKYILALGLLLFIFVLTQELREGISSEDSEPFIITVLARFNGYEPLSIIIDKVVFKLQFDIDIFISNFISFIELPVPRSIYPDKGMPVSILLAQDIFYDIGNRDFETGGISPTIVGSLIWNFHLPGVFLSFFIGYVLAKVESLLLYRKNEVINLLSISLSIYFILAVEAPVNSFGVLWLLSVSWFIIFLFSLITKKRC